MLILSTLFYHAPPRVSTGFTGILFIFYVVFFSNVAENVYILVLSLFHFLFCKVRKKVAGEPFSGAARRISQGEKALVPVQAAKIDFRAPPSCAGGVHRV